MLLPKFQDHWPFGSGEEDFLRFLPHMGMAAILVIPEKLHMKSDFDWPSGFRGEDF